MPNPSSATVPRQTMADVYNNASSHSINGLWCPIFIDLRELADPVSISRQVFEASYCLTSITSHEHAVPLWKSIAAGRRFIVKVMTDPFDAEPLKRETRMYKYLGNTPSPLSPGFLAHVVSRNRVVGFALEKIENAHVILSSDDISCARDALESLHASGLMHGFAINSESYLVTGEGDEKKAYMISFGRTSFRNAVDDAKWGEFPQSDMDDLALLEESLKEIETESKKQDA